MLRTMAEVDIKAGVKNILLRIEQACNRRPPEYESIKPRLVAVSKTKPVEMIIEAYDEGLRHFGENYVNELVEKANNPKILERCKEIQWHFIGNLQSNKINKIVGIPNLYCIETIDDMKLADKLNSAWAKLNPTNKQLRIMVQVNTSGEDAKNGVNPEEVSTLSRHIVENCKTLKLEGLMTIGEFGRDLSQGANADFLKLKECQLQISKDFGIDWKDIELSMGMSADFEHAIELGSTNVRVGSSIFGYREKKTQ